MLLSYLHLLIDCIRTYSRRKMLKVNQSLESIIPYQTWRDKCQTVTFLLQLMNLEGMKKLGLDRSRIKGSKWKKYFHTRFSFSRPDSKQESDDPDFGYRPEQRDLKPSLDDRQEGFRPPVSTEYKPNPQPQPRHIEPKYGKGLGNNNKYNWEPLPRQGQRLRWWRCFKKIKLLLKSSFLKTCLNLIFQHAFCNKL